MSLMSPCPEVLCCCHPFLRLGRFGRTHLHPCTGLPRFHCWQGGYDMKRPRHSVPGSFHVVPTWPTMKTGQSCTWMQVSVSKSAGAEEWMTTTQNLRTWTHE